MNLYAKKIPTSDSVYLKYGGKGKKQDIAIYKDQKCKVLVCIYPWHYKSKPDRRNKAIFHNCAKYNLIWIEENNV